MRKPHHRDTEDTEVCTEKNPTDHDSALMILTHSSNVSVSARRCTSTSALHNTILAPPLSFTRCCNDPIELRRLFRIVLRFCANPALTSRHKSSSSRTPDLMCGR